MTQRSVEETIRPWRTDDPRRVCGRGHPVGDFLEAYAWEVVDRTDGALRLKVHLPPQVLNPRGQLFGGFAPTYVDFVAIHAFRTTQAEQDPRGWLATANMRIDYFEPVNGPDIEIHAVVLHKRGRSAHIETRFLDQSGHLAVLAQATLIEQRR